MNIQKIAAFSNGNEGGNPAGVVIGSELPTSQEMQKIAADVGFSETAFAMPEGDDWKVRYFSPETEVPFCGHATIALGTALAMQNGDGIFTLNLSEATITVEGTKDGEIISAALQSPPTKTDAINATQIQAALDLFSLTPADLDMRFPPALAHAGANHWVFVLNSREKLAAMNYGLDAGRDLMLAEGLITIALAYAQDNQTFHVRNAFASGGVLEDPATGAAAAAFSGYLRDLDWAHGNDIRIIQGEDMGLKSLLRAQFSDEKGSSIKVSGTARVMLG